MKIHGLIAASALIASSLQAADPKAEVTAAAKKLGEQSSYGWRTTTKVPDDAQFRPGPSEGEIEKGGLLHFTSSFNDNVSHSYVKGDKGALSGFDGGWQSLAEVENEEGFGRFRAIQARNYKAPAVVATELAEQVKDLKKDGDVYASALTEEGAKARMRFGGADGGPTISDAVGSVKFWLKDGRLTKFEFSVKGLMDFNGNDFPIDRVTTVEIKNVGTAKVKVPEEAQKLLQ